MSLILPLIEKCKRKTVLLYALKKIEKPCWFPKTLLLYSKYEKKTSHLAKNVAWNFSADKADVEESVTAFLIIPSF